MNLSRLNESDLVTLLFILGQFKRPCDCNRKLQYSAISLLPFLKANYPAASWPIHLTWSTADDSAIVHRGVQRQKRTHIYVEKIIYSLSSYKTNHGITKESSGLQSFKKLPNQAAVQIAETLKDNPFWYEDGYLEYRINALLWRL